MQYFVTRNAGFNKVFKFHLFITSYIVNNSMIFVLFYKVHISLSEKGFKVLVHSSRPSPVTVHIDPLKFVWWYKRKLFNEISKMSGQNQEDVSTDVQQQRMRIIFRDWLAQRVVRHLIHEVWELFLRICTNSL